MAGRSNREGPSSIRPTGAAGTLHVTGAKGELFAMTGPSIASRDREGRVLNADRCLGYAGWGEGQLDEMTRHVGLPRPPIRTSGLV